VILENLMQQSSREEDSHGDGNPDNLRQFLRLKPPAFHGSANPLEAEDWLTEVEKIFDAIHCPDEKKVTFATFMLQGGAFDWWGVHKNKYTEGSVITWKIFKEEFYKKYFPQRVQRKMELEFLQLKQEMKSIAEYEIDFSRLARYAPIYAQDDEAKARRFAQGLRQPLKARVEEFELKSFCDVANKALTVEQAYDEGGYEEECIDEDQMVEGEDEVRVYSPQLPNTGN
jgi:hypothetical protein